MNLTIKHLGLLLVGAFLCVGTSLSAKVERTKVYMFGFSASFTDSVAYIMDVQQVDSAYIETKNDFLIDRVVYSDQLQTFVEAMEYMKNCTCVVFFHTKKSKLFDEYSKIKKRYTQDKSVILKQLNADSGFRFQAPPYIPPIKEKTVVSQQVDKKKKKRGKK